MYASDSLLNPIYLVFRNPHGMDFAYDIAVSNMVMQTKDHTRVTLNAEIPSAA